MADARIEHLVERWKELREQGTPVSSEELCRDCPELLPELRNWLDVYMNAAEAGASSPPPSSERLAPKDVLVVSPLTRYETERCETLRHRLRLVIYLVFTQAALFVVAMLALGERPESAGASLAQLLLLAVAAVLLIRKRSWSYRQLRGMEAVIFGAIALRLAVSQAVFVLEGRMQAFVASGDEDKILMLGELGATRWFVLIVVYGVFIPNRWQRCAAVVGGMALVPLVVLGGLLLQDGMLSIPLVEHFLTKMALHLALAVAIAVYGSYRIDVLQRQAAEARKLGQYVLKGRLGKEGMAEVYLAEHQLLRRPCAVKIIRHDKIESPSHRQRFEREVQALANLSHPNIIEVFDYGVAADGTFYYVMEYVRGLTLHELVERFGALPPARAIHLLRQIAAALGAAHAAGLIHRDIKPANVLVCEKAHTRDVIKLLDFGLVQVCLGDSDARVTQDGMLVGTPAFMSPEQIAGARALDARSDIYSFGVLAYYLLSARNPFDRPEVREVFAAHLHDAAPLLRETVPEIAADLEDVVCRCLAKNPSERFATAGELEKALVACRQAGGWDAEQSEEWWREREALFHAQSR